MDTVTIDANIANEFKPIDSVQLNMLDAINFAIPEIETLTGKLNHLKDKLNVELMQHGEYAARVEEAKEILEKRKKAKQTAMLQPICQEYAEEIKDLRSDLKHTKHVLSQTAIQYTDQTGKTHVRGPSGDMLEIVKTAKLVKVKRKRNE